MSAQTWNEDRIEWRRVGALSTAFNLHIVAGAALLLATANAPPRLEASTPPPPMEVIIVEPKPVDPPPPPINVEPTPKPEPVRTTPTRTTLDRTELVRPQPILAAATPVSAPIQHVSIDTEFSLAPAPSDRGVAYERVIQPSYPADARRQGIEGDTILRVLVGANGRVLDVVLARSSGNRSLDRAALAAVRSWRFQPALESGQPITAWVQIPFEFRINNY